MVRIKPVKGIFILLLGIGLLIGAYDTANAVELNGVSLGPSIVDKTVKPGESFEQEFNVQNRTGEIVRIEAYLQDFREENNQWNKVEDIDSSWSPMTWATVVSAPEKLDNGEQGKIRVRFDVPLNAEAGEHVTYFNSKFIPMLPEQEGKLSAAITVASEIRSLVYVKVTDAAGSLNLKRDWRVIKADTGFWNTGKPVFIVAVTNTGDVHLEVRGNIEIYDVLRNQRTQLNVPLFNVLPGKEKKIEIPWDEAPFIGYFQGNMLLTYNSENFYERKLSFLTGPLLTMAGTVTIIAAIILAVILYIRKLHKRLAEKGGLQDNNPGA
ncbi:hypothetical protein L7E55_02870 [Pelotomaculum isophthalicicum JI]|uniref:DUF916 domain-containing protein n=1 Tax=Pelotomaculum isophthalicicum JI TaxID=947010 RepID=A0A9X4H2I5_9FIRM|nr:hypothetical protein [Pelotomaculum isophthalicicum]MDF9407308.1 hypothetical protein [Pelotomaculum isophthalicicum JI]